MFTKKVLSALFLLSLIFGTIYILSRTTHHNIEGCIFGTTYHVKYTGTQNFEKEIHAELQRIDMSLSIFKDSSTISRFNRNEPFESDEMLDDVIELAQNISKQTDGAFDITVEPLVNAWGFGFKNRANLTSQQIDSILQFVGYSKLIIESRGRYVKKDSRLTIDGGAIAKGYAVDRIAKLLSEKGVKNYMVEIGGEVVVKGTNPKGELWSLGINKPIEDSTQANTELQDIVHLSNRGIATSGNYRNFYYKGGKKFSHTIDPKTGYPVNHSLLSATVITTSCAKSDALATSFMVMGKEKAIAFAQRHKDVDIYLIYADKKGKLCTWRSEGMKKYFKS